MLESEIKKLTAAITRLADLMEGTPVPAAADPAPAEPETAPQPPVEEKPDPAIIRQHAQDKCLDLVRSKRSNKAIIADWLANHDAKTINQLPDNLLVKFTEYLETLKK